MIFLTVQVTDDFLCCALVGPQVRDVRPQLLMSYCSLAVIGQNDLVTRYPQTPQGEDRLLWTAGQM